MCGCNELLLAFSQGTGYVVESFEAALWAFHHSTSFEDGCLRAGMQVLCVCEKEHEKKRCADGMEFGVVWFVGCSEFGR